MNRKDQDMVRLIVRDELFKLGMREAPAVEKSNMSGANSQTTAPMAPMSLEFTAEKKHKGGKGLKALVVVSAVIMAVAVGYLLYQLGVIHIG